jgi:hypothetical protein
MDESGFDEAAVLDVGEADEGDSGDYGVGAAGELFEHAAGFIGGTRFAQDAAFQDDNGVGGDDDGRSDGARGDEFSFRGREAQDHIVRGFAGDGRFVHRGGKHGEREAGIA